MVSTSKMEEIIQALAKAQEPMEQLTTLGSLQAEIEVNIKQIERNIR